MEGLGQIFEHMAETINSQYITLGNATFRLILSMILGVMVGAERKRKGQIAGVRTFSLISMGSCLAMLLSIYVPQEYLGLKNGDPARIAAQVITGVGFIGGGAMIQMKGSVRGLTTAAGIWMTAAIGMAVGVGMYACSIMATMLILLTLVTFGWYEKKRKLGQESRVINLKIHSIIENLDEYKKILQNNHIHISTFFIEYDYDRQETEVNFVILAPPGRKYIDIFDEMRAIAPAKSISLSSQTDI